MKSRIILTLTCLFIAMHLQHLSAQTYTSPVKTVYDELSSQDISGLSAVYISSSMLKFSLSIASAVNSDQKLDSLKLLVSHMDEIILLGDMPSSVFSDEQVKKLENTLKKGGYNLMVKMKDNDEELNVYMLEDSKSEKIRDLVVIVKERNERMVLSITGHMTTQELAAVASLANIDIGDFLPNL